MASDSLKILMALGLTSTVLALLVLLLRLPLRRYAGAEISYTSWLMLPLAMLAMLLPHRVYQDSFTVLTVPVAQWAGVVHAIELPSRPNWSGLVLLAWISGSIIMLIWFALQHSRFLHDLGELTRHEDFYLARSMDAGPALVGLLRTRIVVPGDFFQRYTVEEQTLIITHEKIHRYRGDLLANTLFALLQCLFWFNPVIHLAARYFRVDQELACDARVIVQHPHARRTYAEAMLKTQLHFNPSAIACHWQSHHPLKERIMHLQQTRSSFLQRASAYLLLSMVGGLSAYSAWAVTPANQVGADAASGQAKETAQVDSYMVATSITAGGKTSSPRIVVKQGREASFAIKMDEQQGNWDFSFSLKTPATGNANEAVMVMLVVKKDGVVIAKPNLLVGLDQPAKIQQQTPEHQSDFDISLTASLLKKGDKF
ncbi:energy transducer TonB [Undibacterium sp. CY18W]|uniref:Energy transducer TonB n=1 Tax=Undibacterium hunanense TaxID=2762292 RepID=A0ABR6ZPV0_9BURK|nr:M56 family metallopeptidase [Undibacterium hunanense]MBC3917916.1 energy transducer TonB [Undibacterium hunanense]